MVPYRIGRMRRSARRIRGVRRAIVAVVMLLSGAVAGCASPQTNPAGHNPAGHPAYPTFLSAPDRDTVALRDTFRPLDPCGYVDDAVIQRIGTPAYFGATDFFGDCAVVFRTPDSPNRSWINAGPEFPLLPPTPQPDIGRIFSTAYQSEKDSCQASVTLDEKLRFDVDVRHLPDACTVARDLAQAARPPGRASAASDIATRIHELATRHPRPLRRARQTRAGTPPFADDARQRPPRADRRRLLQGAMECRSVGMCLPVGRWQPLDVPEHPVQVRQRRIQVRRQPRRARGAPAMGRKSRSADCGPSRTPRTATLLPPSMACLTVTARSKSRSRRSRPCPVSTATTPGNSRKSGSRPTAVAPLLGPLPKNSCGSTISSQADLRS